MIFDRITSTDPPQATEVSAVNAGNAVTSQKGPRVPPPATPNTVAPPAQGNSAIGSVLIIIVQIICINEVLGTVVNTVNTGNG